jgi:hypothetical protein
MMYERYGFEKVGETRGAWVMRLRLTTRADAQG